MPWLKAGDNAATHPIVMRVAAFFRAVVDMVLEREVIVNELFGFMVRCALQSAGHTTDYVIEQGTADMLGGPRTDRLLKLAVRSGYVKRIRHLGAVAYQLVDDPAFLHIRLKAEIDWEAEQRADSSNTALTVPVRLRDGDACRYCAKIVNFAAGARKGPRAGTYDHRNPGVKAETPEDLVVACKACNSGRRDYADADLHYPLLPAPLRPPYSAATAAFLDKHGHHVTPIEDLRPGTFSPDPAHSDPAPSGTTRQPPAGRAPIGTRSADSADHLTTESGLSGSGRVGTGSARSPTTSAGTGRRKRSRRGRPRTGGPT